MYALISPNELVAQGARIVQLADEPFDIAPPLFWEKVADEYVAPNTHCYIDGGFAEQAEPTPTAEEPVTPGVIPSPFVAADTVGAEKF